MAIITAIKNRLTQIGQNNTPDDLVRVLTNQGIVAIPNSDTDGIVQRYLVSQGFVITNQIARGIKYISTTDQDVFILPRSIAVFITKFNSFSYPSLLDPSVVQG